MIHKTKFCEPGMLIYQLAEINLNQQTDLKDTLRIKVWNGYVANMDKEELRLLQLLRVHWPRGKRASSEPGGMSPRKSQIQGDLKFASGIETEPLTANTKAPGQIGVESTEVWNCPGHIKPIGAVLWAVFTRKEAH